MSDIDIIEEEVFEFEMTDEVSLFFNKQENCWYLECFNDSLEEEDSIFVLEDDEFSFAGELEAFGVVISDDMLSEYKQIVEGEINDTN